MTELWSELSGCELGDRGCGVNSGFRLSLAGSEHQLAAVCRYQADVLSAQTVKAVKNLSVSVVPVLTLIIKVDICTYVNHLQLTVHV